MPEQLQLRLVTTAEDAKAERSAGAADYRVGEAEKVRFAPQGNPEDRTLVPSFPADGPVEARFVDPVTVTITLTLATLAIRLANHWIRSQEYGVQIDTRTTPVTASKLAGVPFGTLAVIHPDDTTTIHREAYDDPEAVMDTLAQLFPRP